VINRVQFKNHITPNTALLVHIIQLDDLKHGFNYKTLKNLDTSESNEPLKHSDITPKYY